MPKQNFGAGTGEPDGPPRQGEKGGKGGIIKKAGRSMDPGERGNNAGLGRSDSEKERVGRFHFGKEGLGAGTRTGGVSGGKASGGTDRANKDNNPSGKGAGNR
jgi:hypothetical protein